MSELSKAIKRLEDMLTIDVAAVLLMLQSLQKEVAMLKAGVLR